MSSFGEVLGRFSELYGAGSYQEALALVNQERANHPAYDALFLCFSAAMSSRMGDTGAALAAFQSALERGYWYHEGALRGDPDFASLQAIAEFKAIVEQNAQRRQAALPTLKPLLRLLETADMPTSVPLLIVLHGNLSSLETEAGNWQPAVDQGWRVALIQSSRPSWLSGLYDWADVDTALNELDQHYQTLVTQYGLIPSRIVIAGFSRGAFMAERAIIRKCLPASGLLWIEGTPDDEIQPLLAGNLPHNFRAYFAAGQSQDFMPTAGELSDAMGKEGIPCQIEALSNQYHQYPEAFSQTLERALAFLCS